MNVTADTVSSTSISVQWEHLRICSNANDLPVTFRVQYTTVHNMGKVRELMATKTKALLTGLTPHTNYSIKVVAMNVMGDVGPYSYPVTIQTSEDCM